jgi:mono/diheme cytochrome c family protein
MCIPPRTLAVRFEVNSSDVHTTGLPSGAVRGQILADMPAPPPPPPPAATTLAELQASIFTPRCAGCHSDNGASLPGVMNLSNEDATFSSLVGVPSIQQGTLLRAEANDSANSYLIHKLEGARRSPVRACRLAAHLWIPH